MKSRDTYMEQSVSSYNKGSESHQVTFFDKWLVDKLLDLSGDPAIAICLWDNNPIQHQTKVTAKLHIYNRRALFRLLLNPELNFGELYSAGAIEVEGELLDLLESCYEAVAATARDRSWLYQLLLAWQNRPRPNSLSSSLANIHHHYDLGNDFYNLWLDREVKQYTCAYYRDAEQSLEQAQVDKLHHIARKLQLKPGDTVVEAGCGWGGLARFMARHYDVQVKAYNISTEQVSFARERAKEEGLEDRVEYILDDYRNVQGEYDVFVSVGMLEHVGKDHYYTLGKMIDRCLKPDGRGLIHSIGRNAPQMMNAWVEKRIFPGAYPPSLSEMMEIFEPWHLSVLDIENLRLHYAKTLSDWHQRFEQHGDEIREMFDENFVRAWRLYLAGSIAAFRTGDLQLFQVLFTRRTNNQLAWTREHLYQ